MDKDHKPLTLGRRLVGAVLMFVAIFAVAAVLSACGNEDNNSGSTGGAVTEAEQGAEEAGDAAEEGAESVEEGAEELTE